MRKLLIALAILLGVIFILARLAEIQTMWAVLQRGSLFFLALALLIQLIWIYFLSGFYQSLYTALDIPIRRLHLLRLVTAANFLTIIAPSSGLSALAVFITDARRRGHPTARITITGILYVWFEYFGILVLLAPGLTVLSRRGALHWSGTTAAFLLLGIAAALTLLIYLGMKSTTTLGRVLAWLATVANFIARPFLRRQVLDPQRARDFSSEIAEGVSVLRQKPHWVLLPAFYTVLNKALLVLVLGLCFLAFEIEADLGTVIAGLSLAQLFLIMSPTPSGLGIVEGVLAVAFKSLHIPLGDATVVTFAYRAFSFWLPFFIGMVTIRGLEGKKEAVTQSAVVKVSEPS